MIDWFNLAANSLWILGCAIALATLSYASWQASVRKERLRACLNQPGVQQLVFLAGILFCAGLAATADSILETVLWGVLGVLFLAQWALTIRQARGATGNRPPQA